MNAVLPPVPRHLTLLQAATRFGRMSSSKPNLQPMKPANFGLPGVPTLAGFMKDPSFNLKVCKRCGHKTMMWDSHGRRECTYMKAKVDYAALGYVPVHGITAKVLKHAGIKMHWGTSKISAEAIYRKPKKNKQDPRYGPMQQGYYAPVWAVIMYEDSGVKHLTNIKRPRVRELVASLKRISSDADERLAVLGEHILAQGPYTVACKALIQVQRTARDENRAHASAAGSGPLRGTTGSAVLL